MIGRSASRTSVFSPFSVNSLAVQPPVMPEPTTIASNVVCSLTSAPEPPRLRVSLERVLHDWALHEQVPDTRGIHPESFRSAIRLSLPPPRCNKQSKSGAEAWDKNSNCRSEEH